MPRQHCSRFLVGARGKAPFIYETHSFSPSNIQKPSECADPFHAVSAESGYASRWYGRQRRPSELAVHTRVQAATGRCSLAVADRRRRPPSAHACAVQRRHRDNLQGSGSDARVNQATLSDGMFISLTREPTGHQVGIHVLHRRVISVH